MLLLLVKLLLPAAMASAPHPLFTTPANVQQLEGVYSVVHCPMTSDSELKLEVKDDLVQLVDSQGSTIFWVSGLRTNGKILRQVSSEPQNGMVTTNSLQVKFGVLTITSQKEQPFSLGRGRQPASVCELKQQI